MSNEQLASDASSSSPSSVDEDFCRIEFKRLGDECKTIENEPIETTIASNAIVYIRLDGRCFRKFTQTFKKPYDPILFKVFHAAAYDFLQEWQFNIAYFQSDEISFIRLPSYDKHDNIIHLPFNGRVQKLTTVWCSSFTAMFNKYLNQIMESSSSSSSSSSSVATISNLSSQHVYDKLVKLREIYKPAATETVAAAAATETVAAAATTETVAATATGKESKPAVFDLRLCCNSAEHKKNIARSQILWRRYDCIRNAKSAAAHFVFEQNQVQGVSSFWLPRKIEQAARDNDIDLTFEALPEWFRKGTLIIRTGKKFIENDWKIFDQHLPPSKQ